MATIGRVKRCSALLGRRLDETFASFGMSTWEFDVLATLRRSGEPYCLAPTALFSTLMITSGTMTHRLKRLEASGWIEREVNREDARSLLVRLTPSGLELVDRAVEAHLDNERRILAPLSAADLAALDASLATLLAVLEPPRD
jgi:DNA-binding MarR family transcriptional regulator